MAKASEYWRKRLVKDQALAQRSADEVAEEIRREYRLQYAQVAKRLDSLYVEAQRRGELSRTKLWNYLSYRDMEAKLADMVEGGSMIQRDKLTKTLNRVFEDTIGASADKFRRDEYVLPFDPRAVVDTAWSGDSFSNRIWKNNERLAQAIRSGCRGIVMGLESPDTIKQRLMHDFDVTFKQAERLVDTETSYVFNKANLMNYQRRGRQKLTITCLDVNTCDKCKALEGEVFLVEDAPVLPIHPRCHCAYCVPQELDEAEVTMSGGDLDAVYARKGVPGYGDGEGGAEATKEYIPKSLKGRLDARTAPVVNVAPPMEGGTAVTVAAEPVSLPEAAANAATEAQKLPENTGDSVLQSGTKSGIITTGDALRRLYGTLSNEDARKWYLAEDEKIPDQIDRTKSEEEQARQAFELRNKNRTIARELMADQETRKQLDETAPNKTFEELIADKMRRKGMTRGQAIADILKTATKTNREVNRKLGLE